MPGRQACLYAQADKLNMAQREYFSNSTAQQVMNYQKGAYLTNTRLMFQSFIITLNPTRIAFRRFCGEKDNLRTKGQRKNKPGLACASHKSFGINQ